ncbi:MAG: amino acid ABC transporter permease [Actinomycetota bacterium]|nr:amino acid ABC transporter permease [Actinomycetota bacterium]MDA8399625.1 amino acid ABC transporter permease [Actinomycetota bacterium]
MHSLDSLLSLWEQYLPSLLLGCQLTLEVTGIGVAAGLILGVAIGSARAADVPVLRSLARGYVDLLRGTPLLVQIFFIFFALPILIQVNLRPLTAGTIAVALNAGAYFSEVVRSALLTIPTSQLQASQALGLSRLATMRHVVGPQAFLVALPGILNQVTISLKDTSLLAVISVNELTHRGEVIIAATFDALQIWAVVAILYLLMNAALTLFGGHLENRLRRYTA